MEKERDSQSYTVVAVVVTYGSRIPLVTKTLHAILRDPYVAKVILVDNASDDQQGISNLVASHGSRLQVVRHARNLGSAGGFAAGISAARDVQSDYVYLSDDDVVVSEGFVDAFFRAHDVIGDRKSVLCARRASYWAGTDVHYAPDLEVRPRSYFNIFDLRILRVFLASLFGIHDKHVTHSPQRFYPIIPSFGWAYAGVLLPREAVQKAPLPDVSLGLYLDDIVYSWGVTDAGFPSFALMEPHLTDLELTHAGSHVSTGLFSPSVSPTKIYYETRNRVRVSLRYGGASPLLLRLKTAIWYAGVCVLGILRSGMSAHALRRMKLIREALVAGFDSGRTIPEGIAVRV